MAQRDGDAEGPAIKVITTSGEQQAIPRPGGGGPPSGGVSPAPFGPAGGAPGPSTSPAPFGPGPAAPATQPSASLELEERTLPTPKKRLRPELEEWSQELTTGEHAIPPGPAILGPASAADLPVKPPGGAGKKAALAVLLLCALGGVAYLMLSGGSDAVPTVTGERKVAEGEQKQADPRPALGLRPENAPDCWVRDEGFRFVYRTASGEEKTVSRIIDVPPLSRLSAKCIPE